MLDLNEVLWLKRGDLIKVIRSDDSLIEEDSYGIITSITTECVTVVFNFLKPWLYHDGVVVASGGPVRKVPKGFLSDTGMWVQLAMSYVENGDVISAGWNKERIVRCKVYEVDLTKDMFAKRKELREVVYL